MASIVLGFAMMVTLVLRFHGDFESHGMNCHDFVRLGPLPRRRISIPSVRNSSLTPVISCGLLVTMMKGDLREFCWANMMREFRYIFNISASVFFVDVTEYVRSHSHLKDMRHCCCFSEK